MVYIIVKANDGRGMGHIGRVKNWIDIKIFNSSIGVIVNRDYAKMIPLGIWNLLTRDEGYRYDLDHMRPYRKHKTNRTPRVSIDDAIDNYYLSLGMALCLNRDVHLVYIDDQNAPESVFLKKIGQAIGRRSLDIKEIHPGAKIAFEAETQAWERYGDRAMGQTRAECFTDVDYLHLATDADFMKQAIGVFNFTNSGNNKVIPMGFPLGTDIKSLLDGLNKNKRYKANLKKSLLAGLGEPQGKKLLYSCFGAGDGADKVFPVLCKTAEELGDIVFIVGNPGDKLAQLAIQYGLDIKTVSAGLKRIEVSKERYLYLMDFPRQEEHLQMLAFADILLQGSGSGTTYEGIAAQTPIISVPLERPGYEQLIKAVGLKRCGGGELLLLPKMIPQLEQLKIIAAYNKNPIEFDAEELTKENLETAIARMIDDSNTYHESLMGMRSYFADPRVTAEVVKDMANGFHDGPQIIQTHGLKSYT